MKNFNEQIKQLRKSKNITQKQMADLIGVTERAYQYYEAGTREPNLETLRNMSLVLNVSADYLIGIKETYD